MEAQQKWPSKLYKFKSFAQPQQIIDIFENSHIYCSKFQELNDPMEGVFVHYGLKNCIVDELYKAKNKRLIACFTTCIQNEAMWAYYADSARGIAIEIENNFDNSKSNYVNYQSNISEINQIIHNYLIDVNPILFNKLSSFSHENEFRVINKVQDSLKPDNRFINVKISKVFYTNRITQSNKKFLEKLSKLYEIKIEEHKHLKL